VTTATAVTDAPLTTSALAADAQLTNR